MNEWYSRRSPVLLAFYRFLKDAVATCFAIYTKKKRSRSAREREREGGEGGERRTEMDE